MNTQIFLNGITVEQLAEALTPLLKNQTVIQQQESPEDDLLTRDQACKILSINKVTLWKHTRSGKLKSLGIGNRVSYSKKQILEAVKPKQK